MSWKDKPTILKYLDKRRNYVFTDESGHIAGISKLQKKIINGHSVNFRDDSIFLLNSVIIQGSSYTSNLYYSNKIKKEHFSQTDFIFRSNDIHNKKGIFSRLQNENESAQFFFKAMTEYISQTSFCQIASAIDKMNVVNAAIKKGNLIVEEDIIKWIYSAHIIKIAKYLQQHNKSAVLVFEAVNKDFDKFILEIFKALKLRGTQKHDKSLFKNISAVYFTNKSSSSYKPYGELADLTCRPVYKHYQNMEFHALQPKFFEYPHHEGNGLSILRSDKL